jgi:hypothetical protein
MAGTIEDHTTPDDLNDWPLLCDEVAYVAKQHTHSEPAALEHILDQLHWGWTRWRCAKLDYEFVNVSLSAEFAKHSAYLVRFFFRRYHSVRHEVDHVNNCAVRAGVGIVEVRFDDKGNAEPVFDSRYRLTMRATLIRLHHPDIVRGLQRVGLISPLSLVPMTQPSGPLVGPAQTATTGEKASPSSPAAPVKRAQSDEPEASAEPPPSEMVPQPDLPEPEEWDPCDWSSPDTVMLNLGFGPRAWKMRQIIVACRRLPQHPKYKGESIPDILDVIHPAELRRFISPQDKRSDSCERFLVAWKARRSRHPS